MQGISDFLIQETNPPSDHADNLLAYQRALLLHPYRKRKVGARPFPKRSARKIEDDHVGSPMQIDLPLPPLERKRGWRRIPGRRSMYMGRHPFN